jgi:hydroxymethylpyrimidine pyrophosphatase-like HAD family hydrolase
MKTLAIDIDGTWDTDPWTFEEIADVFIRRHWDVILVTGAPQPEAKIIRLNLNDYHIITCQPGQFKRDAALAAGYDVTVWMDNEPGTIEPQRKLTEPKNEEL